MNTNPLLKEISTNLFDVALDSIFLAQLTEELLSKIAPASSSAEFESLPRRTKSDEIEYLVALIQRNRGVLVALHEGLSVDQMKVEERIRGYLELERAERTLSVTGEFKFFTAKMRAESAHNRSCAKILDAVSDFIEEHGIGEVPEALLSSEIAMIDLTSRKIVHGDRDFVSPPLYALN